MFGDLALMGLRLLRSLERPRLGLFLLVGQRLLAVALGLLALGRHCPFAIRQLGCALTFFLSQAGSTRRRLFTPDLALDGAGFDPLLTAGAGYRNVLRTGFIDAGVDQEFLLAGDVAPVCWPTKPTGRRVWPVPRP